MYSRIIKDGRRRGESRHRGYWKLPRYYPETVQRIIDLIGEKPDITRQKLAEKIGISPDGVKYHLTRLKNKGTIKRIGPDKGGYWKILKNGVIKNLETKE